MTECTGTLERVSVTRRKYGVSRIPHAMNTMSDTVTPSRNLGGEPGWHSKRH